MTLLRFEHINLSCKDIDVTKNFYQTLFPDWYVRVEGTSGEGCWMHFGNDQFYLALNEEPEAERSHTSYRDIGINHIGLVINNGEAMLQLLETNGIEYYIYNSPETKHRIYIDDPDGNEIELVEYHEEYALK